MKYVLFLLLGAFLGVSCSLFGVFWFSTPFIEAPATTVVIQQIPLEIPGNLDLSQKYLNIETILLAKTVYYEARNQSVRGQIAIIAVILNRSQKSGKSIAEVINSACEFAWPCSNFKKTQDLDSLKNPVDLKAWNDAKDLALDQWLKYNDSTFEDPTGSATFYHTKQIKKPKSWKNLIKTVTIGSHIFYKEKESK